MTPAGACDLRATHNGAIYDGPPACLLVLSGEPDLLEERDEVVHQVLLDDLSVGSFRDGAEVDLERLARWRDLAAVRALHWAGHRAAEAGD